MFTKCSGETLKLPLSIWRKFHKWVVLTTFLKLQNSFLSLPYLQNISCNIFWKYVALKLIVNLDFGTSLKEKPLHIVINIRILFIMIIRIMFILNYVFSQTVLGGPCWINSFILYKQYYFFNKSWFSHIVKKTVIKISKISNRTIVIKQIINKLLHWYFHLILKLSETFSEEDRQFFTSIWKYGLTKQNNWSA